MLTITTPATETRLALIDSVKLDLNITNDDDDEVISYQIDRASSYIIGYTGRVFARETVNEKLPARNEPTIVLTRTPIITLTSVKYNGALIDSSEYSIDDANAGVIFRETGWSDTTLWDYNITATPTRWGKRLWEFDYISGYALPGTEDTGAKLPEEVEKACIDIVKSWYLRRDQDPIVMRQRTGDSSETLFDSKSAVPPFVNNVLNRYKRIMV